MTDYVQVHTCVFRYLIALGDWCLSWQIYLLKAKLFGWQDYRMPEGESPNAESKREGMCNVQKAWGSYKASRKKIDLNMVLICSVGLKLIAMQK